MSDWSLMHYVDGQSCVPNSIISREISNKIEEFARQYLEGDQDGGEIAVVFLQKKSKKGWFAVTEVTHSFNICM